MQDYDIRLTDFARLFEISQKFFSTWDSGKAQGL
jgi:hypothetical protein